MKLPKPRYNIVIPQRGMQRKCIEFNSTLYEYCSLIERAKCRSPRYIMASLKKVLVFVVVKIAGFTFCLIQRLTQLLKLDEMLWYIHVIILINTNNPPGKFGTVEFLCAVLTSNVCFSFFSFSLTI